MTDDKVEYSTAVELVFSEDMKRIEIRSENGKLEFAMEINVAEVFACRLLNMAIEARHKTKEKV